MERRKVLICDKKEAWFLAFGTHKKKYAGLDRDYYRTSVLVEMSDGSIEEFDIYDIRFIDSDKALEERESLEYKRREELYSNPIIDIINLFKKLFKNK